jgi:hypothetical protein
MEASDEKDAWVVNLGFTRSEAELEDSKIIKHYEVR